MSDVIVHVPSVTWKCDFREGANLELMRVEERPGAIVVHTGVNEIKIFDFFELYKAYVLQKTDAEELILYEVNGFSILRRRSGDSLTVWTEAMMIPKHPFDPEINFLDDPACEIGRALHFGDGASLYKVTLRVGGRKNTMRLEEELPISEDP